ncbi:RNA-binding protein NOB1 isoform X2 [Pieris brassicae]|uniref:RNA-binding protein NOB1 isoform X2 n=1 Tax=Pieris brassicae TaxID=7116 RepID=UPI001E660025|nr:RNA-binding protein NOB1 isoform X2 [Pieris brassicae]
MAKLIKHLVVDTTAFIKAEDLQEIAENIYTVQEVVDEITNDRQRRKLVVLPYDLKVKDVFTESIKFMTEFSKKTGDYTSLSATDIKVMALTYQMEKEISGIEHLKTEPTMQKTVKITGLSGRTPDTNKKDDIIKSNDEALQDTTKVEEHNDESSKINCNEDDDDSKLAHEIVEKIKNMELTDEKEAENVIVKVEESESDEGEISSEDDDDGSEWITPSNLKEKKKEMDLGEFEQKNVDVACITSDFAMQNVLKQIGLNVTAVDGFSPFAMKDVNSKSAVLGVRADKQDLKYWMKHYSKDKKK